MSKRALERAVDEAIRRALERAVDEAIRREGSLRRVAERLGVTRQAIQQWTSVPVKRVLMMEEMSDVSRYELRPDIYGEAPQRAEEQAA